MSYEEQVAARDSCIFVLAVTTLAALLITISGCGPAERPPAPTDFYPAQPVAGNAYLHLDRSLTQQERVWAEDAYSVHYWVWRSAGYGPLILGRDTHVYVLARDHITHLSPQGYVGDPHGYLAADDATPGAPRDEIVVVFGPKGTLPGLMSQLHHASLWPRDPYQQDLTVGWDQILGYTPSPTPQAPTPARVPGLQERVVEWLMAQR